MHIRPFTVDWSDEAIARVITRVADTRLPPALPGAGWSLGCDADFLARMQAYWTRDYDVGAAIAALNRHAQFLADIDGHTIHFVHIKGEGMGRRPLLLTHGWPGSHYEYWDLADRLAFPSRHGGSAADAFDLVIPSLPGFGFSGKPADLIGQRETARLWNKLMTEGLGYSSCLAQGGDFGALVTTWLSADYPESVRAIHLNMLCLLQPDPPADETEAAYLRAERSAHARLGGYVQVQLRKPQSIAWAAADNPLGQAAWIAERFHDWTDVGDRELDEVFPMDHLVTNAMIYVMTDSFASAAWYYQARMRESRALGGEYPRCRVPTAYAAFPGDPLVPIPPRSRTRAVYDITRWTDMPRGGHFAAMQEPALFADDVIAWGREAWRVTA